MPYRPIRAPGSGVPRSQGRVRTKSKTRTSFWEGKHAEASGDIRRGECESAMAQVFDDDVPGVPVSCGKDFRVQSCMGYSQSTGHETNEGYR